MSSPAPRLDQIAREHLGIETLAARGADALDFHEVPVWGLESALLAAGATASKAAQIARASLGIETLEQRWSDALDFHEVSVWGLRQALESAAS